MSVSQARFSQALEGQAASAVRRLRPLLSESVNAHSRPRVHCARSETALARRHAPLIRSLGPVELVLHAMQDDRRDFYTVKRASDCRVRERVAAQVRSAMTRHASPDPFSIPVDSALCPPSTSSARISPLCSAHLAHRRGCRGCCAPPAGVAGPTGCTAATP